MTRRSRWPIAILLLATSAAAGCADRVEVGPQRPRTKHTTISTDGRREAITLHLYSSPPEFALPFSTYVPEGMAGSHIVSDSGDAVSFTARGSGGERHDAFVHTFVSPPWTTEDAAREVVRGVAERYRVPGDRTELEPIRRHPWAMVEYRIRSRGLPGRPLTGWVALGRHNERWFHIIAQYPEASSAFYEPRVQQLLEEWRWADSGRGLSTAE